MKTLIVYLLIINAAVLLSNLVLISYALDFRRMIRREMHEFEGMIKDRISAFLDVFKRNGRRERE